jgi:hypothetical protein
MSDESYSLSFLYLETDIREDFTRGGWVGEGEILEDDG